MLRTILALLFVPVLAFGQADSTQTETYRLTQTEYGLDELAKTGVDGLEFIGGGGEGSDNYRIAVSWQFMDRGIAGGAWQLKGALTANMSAMDSNVVGGEEGGTLRDTGITPVWTLISQRFANSLLEPFVEAGIGFHYLSEKEVGVKTFSTNFQFGDHIGLGVKFGPERNYRLTYQFQHLSNGGIDAPNPGINFHLVSLGYQFK